MKQTEVNKKGNWKYPWTEELKNTVETAAKNTVIGEKLVMENDDYTVWSIHLPVGESLPFHTHNKPYLYSAESSGKSRSFYADGRITETEYKKDDLMCFNDLSETNFFTHNLENIGNTTLIFTTVEFKR